MKKRRPTYPADRKRSYADIETIAREWRTTLIGGLPEIAAMPGRQVFENHLKGKPVRSSTGELPLDYSCSTLPWGVEGETRHDVERDCILICLSEDTYDGLQVERPRARFSLYHEIGHGVMHVDELIRLARIPHPVFTALMRASIPKHNAFEDTEWQANAFAAAILMPARGLARLEKLHGPLQPSMIAEGYRVSLPAATRRLLVFQNYREGLLL